MGSMDLKKIQRHNHKSRTTILERKYQIRGHCLEYFMGHHLNIGQRAEGRGQRAEGRGQRTQEIRISP